LRTQDREPNNRIRAAVLGCTGLVGQQFVRMLDGHPDFETVALTASERSAGKPYGAAAGWRLGEDVPAAAAGLAILPTSPDSVLNGGAEVAFSALPAEAADRLEPELRRHGLFIFSNASSRRRDPDVPVLVPEINPAHLALAERQTRSYGGAIVANSNCSTAGLVLVLAPLLGLGLESVTVMTCQAVSGAGRRGVAAMEISANVIPYIRNEEEKVSREPRKILGTLGPEGIRDLDIEVNAACCRVPVREGHLLGLRLDFGAPVEVEAVKEALSRFTGLPQELALPTAPGSPILVREEDDRPQPALDAWAGRPDRARGMAVTVGRVRGTGRSINCFALVHNTVRGAAGTCILTAELALRQGLLRAFVKGRQPAASFFDVW
jgi:aspartate-semialdehyde dehydrogenase